MGEAILDTSFDDAESIFFWRPWNNFAFAGKDSAGISTRKKRF